MLNCDIMMLSKYILHTSSLKTILSDTLILVLYILTNNDIRITNYQSY